MRVWHQPAKLQILLFSLPMCAGLRFEGLPVDQVGIAVAMAAADKPSTLPLRAAERKAVEARQVGCCQFPCTAAKQHASPGSGQGTPHHSFLPPSHPTVASCQSHLDGLLPCCTRRTLRSDWAAAGRGAAPAGAAARHAGPGVLSLPVGRCSIIATSAMLALAVAACAWSTAHKGALDVHFEPAPPAPILHNTDLSACRLAHRRAQVRGQCDCLQRDAPLRRRLVWRRERRQRSRVSGCAARC